MTSIQNLAQERLLRLACTLASLRERVREAVASEMGRAVGDAVRDLLTAALDPGAARAATASPRYRDEHEDPWDDEDDWHGPSPDARPRPAAPEVATAPPARWATALTVGVALARWLLARRTPLLALVAAGSAVALLPLGGPLSRAALGAAATARDLLAVL